MLETNCIGFDSNTLNVMCFFLLKMNFPTSCWFDKTLISESYPEAVFLPVLPPVVSRVAEHQQVSCQPIRATVASLRGDSCDLRPPPQIHFQPLVSVRDERRPTSSSCSETETEMEKVLLAIVTFHLVMCDRDTEAGRDDRRRAKMERQIGEVKYDSL